MEFIKKKVVEHGSRGERPGIGSLCNVQILTDNLTECGKTEWFTTHDPTGIELGLSNTEFDRAVERALYTMDVGEKSEFLCTPLSGLPFPIVIHLTSATNYQSIHLWTPEALRHQSEEYRSRGVSLYKVGRCVDAFHYFSRSLKLMLCYQAKHDDTPDTDFLNALYGNLAMCHLKRDNFEPVVYFCDKVLSISAGTSQQQVKLLYRKGVALSGLRQFAEALETMQQAFRLEPTNQAVMQECQRIKRAIDIQEAPLKQGMRKMFGNK